MRRPWALPLVPVYAAALRMENALRRPPRELAWPVVSVGSLNAGGAGKTPVVKMLAELLVAHGVPCDVLSRGYGRRSTLVDLVDPAGDARRFGDEPMELAQAGLEVWVGADRFQAGTAAESMSPNASGVHLLDDGFQHRQLARTLNVVLLTQEDAQESLLPAGNLREPLSALSRADVLVVRAEEAETLEPWTREHAVWVVRRSIRLPASRPRRPLAFCGIARPDDFLRSLNDAGCHVAGAERFPDHHAYSAKDVDRLVAAARQAGADGFVTTAKDAVKLAEAMRARLGNVVTAELQVQALDPEAVWTRLQAALQTGTGVRK